MSTKRATYLAFVATLLLLAMASIPAAAAVPFSESFSYPDGTDPPTISHWSTGGFLRQLDVREGKLKAVLDTHQMADYAILHWRPEGVVIEKDDMVTIAFEGLETTGYHAGHHRGRFRIVPVDSPMDEPWVFPYPGLSIGTQNRYSAKINVAGYDETGVITKIAPEMYSPEDGTHFYRLELNHVAGGYQPGALRFYRDGELKASSDDVSAYLPPVSKVVFRFDCGDPYGAMYTWDDVVITVRPPALEVDIDIKPGSYPNAVNINGNGVVPVAILGSEELDVVEIDPSSLVFGGLSVRTKKNGSIQCSIEDVSGDFAYPEGAPDSYDDLVCQFVDEDGFLAEGDGTAKVEGSLWDGLTIYGYDSIKLINQ